MEICFSLHVSVTLCFLTIHIISVAPISGLLRMRVTPAGIGENEALLCHQWNFSADHITNMVTRFGSQHLQEELKKHLDYSCSYFRLLNETINQERRSYQHLRQQYRANKIELETLKDKQQPRVFLCKHCGKELFNTYNHRSHEASCKTGGSRAAKKRRAKAR